jgi:hypothetical protein
MKFGKRFKRAMKKTGRGLKKAAKVVHNVTHKGPIGKARDAVAKVVKKIPIAKQFVEIGEMSSRNIHRALGLKEKKKKKNTGNLMAAAGKMKGDAGALTQVAMAGSALVDKELRGVGALTKPRAQVQKAAKSAAKKLAKAANAGHKAAAKGLAIAAAAHQVARGADATTVRKTLAKGGALKAPSSPAKKTRARAAVGKGQTYEVRNVLTGKLHEVTL